MNDIKRIWEAAKYKADIDRCEWASPDIELEGALYRYPLDRVEKLIALGEAAWAREIASDEYDYAIDRLGKETVHAKAVIYDAADDVYWTALKALKETP